MGDIQTIQSNQNYLPELDENGQPMINPTFYKNTITDLIYRYIQETQTDPHKPTLDINKLTNNNLLAINLYIFETLFKNKQRHHDDNKSNIPYTTNNITELLNIYIDITVSLNCIPSLYGFSKLTGITEETIKKYVTPSSLEILNIRREMLRNELYNDRMGRIVLANNDTSFGLEYEKKNTLERETIKQGLTLQELPRLD